MLITNCSLFIKYILGNPELHCTVLPTLNALQATCPATHSLPTASHTLCPARRRVVFDKNAAFYVIIAQVFLPL